MSLVKWIENEMVKGEIEEVKKFLKILLYVLGAVAILWLILFLWPVNERQNRGFFREDDSDLLVIAHGGAKHLAPENTMAAFQNAYDMDVDVLEYDVHITLDGHLVAIHDDTVDRTTNGNGRVNDLTLEQIQELDAGYNFDDLDGNQSFRNSGVIIPTVEEVLAAFPDKRHLIELKATNDPELHEEMIQEMWRLTENYNMQNDLMVASFDHEINERFDEIANGTVAIGAGEQEVRPFVERHILFLNALYQPNADAFQLPLEQEGFDLASWNLLRGAHQRDMHVYYWTINDEETMRELIDKGADGIITDRPDLLIEILAENAE